MFGILFDFTFHSVHKNYSALAMVLVKVARRLFQEGYSFRSEPG